MRKFLAIILNLDKDMGTNVDSIYWVEAETILLARTKAWLHWKKEEFRKGGYKNLQDVEKLNGQFYEITC